MGQSKSTAAAAAASADSATGEAPPFGRPRVLRGHTDIVRQVCVSPDSQLIASASADRTCKLWEARSGALLRTLLHPKPCACVDFSPDGARLLTGCNRKVRLFDVKSGALLTQFACPGRVAHALW